MRYFLEAVAYTEKRYGKENQMIQLLLNYLQDHVLEINTVLGHEEFSFGKERDHDWDMHLYREFLMKVRGSLSNAIDGIIEGQADMLSRKVKNTLYTEVKGE